MTASSINIKDVSFPVAMHQESTNYEAASTFRSISCDVKGQELKSFHLAPSSQSRAPSQWDIFYDVDIHFLVESQLSNSAYSVSVVTPAQSSFDTDARWAPFKLPREFEFITWGATITITEYSGDGQAKSESNAGIGANTILEHKHTSSAC